MLAPQLHCVFADHEIVISYSVDLVVFSSLLHLSSVADGWFKQSDRHRQQTEGSVWKITSWKEYLGCLSLDNVFFIYFKLLVVLAWDDTTNSISGTVNVTCFSHKNKYVVCQRHVLHYILYCTLCLIHLITAISCINTHFLCVHFWEIFTSLQRWFSVFWPLAGNFAHLICVWRDFAFFDSSVYRERFWDQGLTMNQYTPGPLK